MADRCLVCHRKLKDEESKRRGMGPTCWRRVMKVVKADKKRRKERRVLKKISHQIEGQINLFDEIIEEKGDS